MAELERKREMQLQIQKEIQQNEMERQIQKQRKAVEQKILSQQVLQYFLIKCSGFITKIMQHNICVGGGLYKTKRRTRGAN